MKYLSIISLILLLVTNGMSTTYSPDPTKDALYMLEEERLAMEVYQAFFEKWEHHTFQNIAQAEGRHLEKVKNLLSELNPGLDLSSDDTNRGVYKNVDLQNLYNDLVKRGSISLLNALKVGAEIEEMNINDLEASISLSETEVAKTTYEKLLNASYNHLRSFVRNIEKSGESYNPVLLDQEKFESIIAQASNQKKGKMKNCMNESKNSKCNKSCSGKNGNKNGKSGKCGKSNE